MSRPPGVPLKDSGIRVLCQCPDCYLHPSAHPVTGLPSTGRAQGCWITERERLQHTKMQREYAVANLLLPSDYSNGFKLESTNHDSFVGLTETPTLGSSDVDYESPLTHFSFISPPPDSSASRSRTHVPSEGDKRIIKEFDILRSQIRDANSIIHNDGIYFSNPPTLNDASTSVAELDDRSLDDLCSLDPRILSNSTIIGYQTTLAKTKTHAHSYIKHNRVEVRLQAELTTRTVEEQQKLLRALLLAEWERQKKLLKNEGYFQSDRFFRNPARALPMAVLAVYLLFGTLHLLSHLSLDDCNFSLKCVGIALSILLATSSSIHAPSVSKSMHTDIRVVLDILDVHPQSRAFIVCPKCSKLHWVNPETPDALPAHCEGQEFGDECETPLLREQRNRTGSSTSTPRRQYHHQPLKDYIARLYSRRDLKQYLDRNLKDLRTSGDGMWDVWDAPCLSEFKGGDGLVFVDSKTEGRLIFSLNMDGFNPYGNREAGKTVSVGGIYMVCLNLPPSLRYKMENVYLAGIIPGPHSPSAHEINYFLAPLVDDLLELWHTGVFLSRTSNHPLGRRVRCALGPLVCDLPAART